MAVFVRLAPERFVVLHLGVQPRTAATAEMNTRVLLKLMHEIRSAARRAQGVDRIELVYKRPARGAPARLIIGHELELNATLTASFAALGARPIRSTSIITIANGACRCTMIGGCSKCFAWRARRRA